LLQKFNYKGISKKKPNPSARPSTQRTTAQPRGPTARSARTRPTAGRGLRSKLFVKNAPALSANRPALLLTIPRETSNATRTLQTSPVTTARSLATPALAGAVTRAQACRPEQPGTSPTPLGGRHSPTGQGAASGSGWTGRDAAGRLLPEDGQPAKAATLFR
jgi:hypothetical protein